MLYFLLYWLIGYAGILWVVSKDDDIDLEAAVGFFLVSTMWPLVLIGYVLGVYGDKVIVIRKRH
jgi:hypothetical protein